MKCDLVTTTCVTRICDHPERFPRRDNNTERETISGAK